MSSTAADPGPHEYPHGSLAEEAGRLAEALAGWVNTSEVTAALRKAGTASGGDNTTPGAGAECAVCPVCQLLRMLRGLRPEVFEHLTVASAALLAAARAAFQPPDAATAAEHDEGVTADGTAFDPPPRVRPPSQRIDIR